MSFDDPPLPIDVPRSSHLVAPRWHGTARHSSSADVGVSPAEEVVRGRAGIRDVDECSNKPVFLEVCCGSAGLAGAMGRYEFDALGVDHHGNRHVPKAKVLEIDLTTQFGVDQLTCLCVSGTVAAVWFGIPCGTASRARLIRRLLRGGRPAPPPLRTDSEPWGRTDASLDELQPCAYLRLHAANAIYRATLKIIELLIELGIPWAIKNPARSLLWSIPEFGALLGAGASDVVYDACMFGSRRKKAQRLRGTLNLNAIGISCDGLHDHEPWFQDGRLKAAEEAEYTEGLCEALAAAISADRRVQDIRKLIASSPVDCYPTEQHRRLNSALAAATSARSARELEAVGVGRQPRGGRVPEVVPEFKHVYLVQCSAADAEVGRQVRDKAGVVDAKGFVHNDLVINGFLVNAGHRVIDVDGGSAHTRCEEAKWIKVGAPWTPAEFINEASKASHPFDDRAKAPDDLKKAIWRNLTEGVAATYEFRNKALAKWKRRAEELQSREDRLFAEAHAEVQPCLRGKRSLLLEEMAGAAGFPRPRLLGELLRKGCPPFGSFPAWGCFRSKATPATKSLKEVLAGSLWVKHAITGRVGPSKDADLDWEVLRKTEEEVEAGKAKGPIHRCGVGCRAGQGVASGPAGGTAARGLRQAH